MDFGRKRLREPLLSAADGDVIGCDPPSASIVLTSGELMIPKQVTLRGPGAGRLIIGGGGVSRVFHLGPGGGADISGLTIRDGLAPAGGGGAGQVAGSAQSGSASNGRGGDGGNGGAIYNGGTASLQSMRLSQPGSA